MSCPLCRTRKERRACPALHETICAVCCGTKRLTEIQCPDDCVYLSSAREHPAAVVKRQQEHDVAILLPTIEGLTERQYQLFFLFQSLIARHTPEGFARLIDEDVAEAAGAAASTLETAARGVIYEHAASSSPAKRLAGELQALLAEMRQQGATVYDREVAIVLRAIERGARETRKVEGTAEQGEQRETAYLTLMARLLQRNRAAPQPASAPSSFDHSVAIHYNLGFGPDGDRRICAESDPDRLRVIPSSPGDDEEIMAKVCEVCGKKPVVGRTISHAHNVGPRRFEPNLQLVRALINGATKRMRVCTRCLRSGKVTKAA